MCNSKCRDCTFGQDERPATAVGVLSVSVSQSGTTRATSRVSQELRQMAAEDTKHYFAYSVALKCSARQVAEVERLQSSSGPGCCVSARVCIRVWGGEGWLLMRLQLPRWFVYRHRSCLCMEDDLSCFRSGVVWRVTRSRLCQAEKDFLFLRAESIDLLLQFHRQRQRYEASL